MTENIVSQGLWDQRHAETLWLYADCMLFLYRKVCPIKCPSIDLEWRWKDIWLMDINKELADSALA